MVDSKPIPLYPEHSLAKEPDAPPPLYNSKKCFLAAQQTLQEYLEANFPSHFGKQGQPWAIGLRDELLDALADTGYPAPLIRHTLHYFSRSVRYLTNCVLSGYGADRYHLDGTKEGSVTRRELIFALTQLGGLVQRKDPLQAEKYRVWAMREMVLGLVRQDLTPASLERAKVRKKVIKRAERLAEDPAKLDELQLRNKRTGEPHPAVYAAPYLPAQLHKAFQSRHPEHITSGKLKAKSRRRARVKTLPKPAPAPRVQTTSRNTQTLNVQGSAFHGSSSREGLSLSLAGERRAKQTTVIVKRRRRLHVDTSVGT